MWVPFVPHQHLTVKINEMANDWTKLIKLINTWSVVDKIEIIWTNMIFDLKFRMVD